jgi:DNA-binding NarL/FixJ family response regulator
MKTRIAIAEDNSYLLKSILDRLQAYDVIDIRLTARDGIELQEKIVDHQIDLILMDIEMPRQNGIETTAWVKSKFPQIKVVMITVVDDDERIFEAIKAGADGYLLKEVSSAELYAGICNVMQGGSAMTPSIALKTLKLLRNSDLAFENHDNEEFNLSEREIVVLEQLAAGLSYTKIAENLFRSPSTIRKHIENIYKKLQVHSKLEAVEKAKRNHLI